MTLIPGTARPGRFNDSRLRWGVAVAVAACAWLAWLSDANSRQDDETFTYQLDYRVTLIPAKTGAQIEMRLQQPAAYLRELDMPTLGGRLTSFSGDGDLTKANGRVTWLPPEDGGTLRWFARLEHRRGKAAFDAHIERDWALFRGEDIIPSASTRSLKGANGETRLHFEVPAGWSIVTPYREDDGRYFPRNAERRFDTPTGWIVAGKLGVRIETIAGRQVVVAGPVGHSVRRMDLLALLQWTLPDLVRLVPDFPERLTIVSAGDPMWRGALSAPQSLYIHADRPMLSGNSTSTLVHETVHIGMGLSDAQGADWILEGLAEYYSLEILRRTRTISEKRFRNAHRDLAAWAADAEGLCSEHSNGSETALAVTVMRSLDAEIREHSGGRASLDDVMRELATHSGKLSVADFRKIAEKVAGQPTRALQPDRLDNCGDPAA